MLTISSTTSCVKYCCQSVEYCIFIGEAYKKNNSINFVIMNLVANRIVNTIIPGVHSAAALVPKTPLVVMPSF